MEYSINFMDSKGNILTDKVSDTWTPEHYLTLAPKTTIKVNGDNYLLIDIRVRIFRAVEVLWVDLIVEKL